MTTLVIEGKREFSPCWKSSLHPSIITWKWWLCWPTAGWPAQPVPPVSTVEGIIYPLWAFVSQLAPIGHPTLLPVYPSVSQWDLFFFFFFFLTATSHSSICVATVCSFSMPPKMTFIAAASLSDKGLWYFGDRVKIERTTEMPPRGFLWSFVSLYIYTPYMKKHWHASGNVNRAEGKESMIKLHFPYLLVPRMLEMWFTLSNILQRSTNNSRMDKCE